MNFISKQRSKRIILAVILVVFSLCAICGCEQSSVDTANGTSTETDNKAVPVVCEEHNLSGWRTYTVPDCSKEGEERRVCSVCGYYEQRTTEKMTVHVYSDGKCSICNTELTPNADYIIANFGYIQYVSSNAEHLIIPEVVGNEKIIGIENDALSDCKRLKYVTLPASLQMITGGFTKCTDLLEVYIGEGVTQVDGVAFEGCTNLKRIIVSEKNEKYYSDGNCIISRSGVLAAGCNYSSIDADANIKEIGDAAFTGREQLESIEIPDSVTKIGEHAFSKCYSLKKIVLPASLTKIGMCAFSYCSSIREVKIPASVTYIGKLAFNGCTSLSKIEFEDKEGWYNGSKKISVDDPYSAASDITDRDKYTSDLTKK
ncbi:MAG: leucine-rich repeat domain-containing protein [Clostridia bacterium]|nr:leucine-rich repeat domain-containing protein [Clostridia bacterium]